MILDLDIGNTRVKWRLLDDAGSSVQRGSQLIEQDGQIAWLSTVAGKLDCSLEGQCRVRVSSVRGATFNTRLDEEIQAVLRSVPEFAAVSESCCGVTNSYESPTTMGVDRWLAMIAAYRHAGRACAIIDLGSAVTFDLVDAAGVHQGGYIVPGLQLMLDSLIGKSPALDVELESVIEPVPGTSTREAIGNGLLAMLLGFARQCHQAVDTENGSVDWYLTGGDADKLAPHIPWHHTLVQDLVLDGLALVLP